MIATAFYLMITILVSFYKYDFLNLTAATVALYMLSFTDSKNFKPKFFRALVAAIIISLIYDINWFWTKYRAFSDEDDEDGGGIERSLKRFSWAMATIAFFYKFSSVLGSPAHSTAS